MPTVARLLVGQVGGLGLLCGGFWLLFQGFLRPNIPLGILGGAMIPAGMWVMARLRRGASRCGEEPGRPGGPAGLPGQ